MARLSWNAPSERIFETGLDRGVLYPKNGTRPVVWNGLTSVDEEGAETASSYYIDGRPFLYLPKPKEFEATIRAYTYPDEFAPMMGLAEAADGMFLDSQMSDSFDLSYRTIVGDGVDGLKRGYKIHLIYNAVVSPQSVAYESLSSDVNPVEFSWTIQAVPIRVDGYRATAHVVIDTRNMEQDKLDQIEAFLYGTPTSDPVMPHPQVIFDILSYGDTIVVTVHDNGTWSAKGSYKKIYMTAPGVFQIEDINAEHHGDGTYTISTGGNTVVEYE